jgi:hypothetical protein
MTRNREQHLLHPNIERLGMAQPNRSPAPMRDDPCGILTSPASGFAYPTRPAYE